MKSELWMQIGSAINFLSTHEGPGHVSNTLYTFSHSVLTTTLNRVLLCAFYGKPRFCLENKDSKLLNFELPLITLCYSTCSGSLGRLHILVFSICIMWKLPTLFLLNISWKLWWDPTKYLTSRQSKSVAPPQARPRTFPICLSLWA